MKKASIFLCVLCFVSILFTGCNSAEKKDGDEASPQTTESTTEDSTENNTITIIRHNLDILAENDPNELMSETGIINNNLFDEIVAFGEEALPFLESITDRSNTSVDGYEDPGAKIEQRMWAVYVIYTIIPETYDLFFVSPDDKYTVRIIVDSLESFFNHGPSYNNIKVTKNVENELAYETKMEYDDNMGGIFSPDVNWSADSRFAVVDCTGRRSGSAMVLDMQEKSDINLPGVEEAINHAFPGKDVDSLLLTPRFWFSFEAWESDTVVKISYHVGEIADGKNFSGWYTYDLVQRKVLQMEHSFDD